MSKTVRIDIRVTPHDIKVLDERRGNQTRSDWLRRKIHEKPKQEETP